MDDLRQASERIKNLLIIIKTTPHCQKVLEYLIVNNAVEMRNSDDGKQGFSSDRSI